MFYDRFFQGQNGSENVLQKDTTRRQKIFYRWLNIFRPWQYCTWRRIGMRIRILTRFHNLKCHHWNVQIRWSNRLKSVFKSFLDILFQTYRPTINAMRIFWNVWILRVIYLRFKFVDFLARNRKKKLLRSLGIQCRSYSCNGKTCKREKTGVKKTSW